MVPDIKMNNFHPQFDFKEGDKVIYDYYVDLSIKIIKLLESNESELDQWNIPYRYAFLDSGEKVRTYFLKKIDWLIINNPS